MIKAIMEMDISVVFAVAALAVAFAAEYFVCCKAKRWLVKLLLVSLSVLAAIVFSVLSAIAGGWDGFGYLYFALLSVGMLIASGVAWLLWAIRRK